MDQKIKIQIVAFLCMTAILALVIVYINPIQEVPVMKVNVTFVEREGIVDAENYTFTQGTVSYINRPKKIQADSFPAICARTVTLKGKERIIGPWEMLSYNGSGNYLFNIGFYKEHYPEPNDIIHISVIVVDKNGERIGYIIENIKWK